jgi:hypothetical protein
MIILIRYILDIIILIANNKPEKEEYMNSSKDLLFMR